MLCCTEFVDDEHHMMRKVQVYQGNIVQRPSTATATLDFYSTTVGREVQDVSHAEQNCSTRISIVAGQVKFSASVLHFNPNSSGWSRMHVKMRELSTYSECSYDEWLFRYDHPCFFSLLFS